MIAYIIVQKLITAIHAHQSAGSHVEATSNQRSSGDSSWAALRPKFRLLRAFLLKGSIQSDRSHAAIASPTLPSCHSVLPRLCRVPEDFCLRASAPKISAAWL